MTSNGSESVQRKKKIEKFTEKMTRKTKFTESEVERLVLVYQKITVRRGTWNKIWVNRALTLFVISINILKESRYTTLKLDRKKFYEFLGDTFGMTDKIIMDRLYKYFNKIATDNIDVEEWVTGFSVFLKGPISTVNKNKKSREDMLVILLVLPLGNEEEWTQFCFNIYDLNEDGYITKEEIMTMMKNCFVHKVAQVAHTFMLLDFSCYLQRDNTFKGDQLI